MGTTFKMALPPLCLLLSNQLLLQSSRNLPSESLSAANYSICGVAVCTMLLIKRKFFLTQVLAVFFIAKGLDQIPSDSIVYEFQESELSDNRRLLELGYIVLAILFYGFSYVMLEKILKASEVSLWIRGIQLNIFAVPLSLMISYINDWNNEDPRGFFDSFNIIAWFFIVFKIAQQMMELFVIKVADSIYRSLSLSAALVIIGLMKYPIDFYQTLPMQLASGLVLTGISLYIIIDLAFQKWGDPNDVEDDYHTYRDLPIDFNDTLSKGYQTVQTVSSSVSNTEPVFLKLLDEPLRET